jgi:DhnA family fructose-bisphosphate aldolase class Ia
MNSRPGLAELGLSVGKKARLHRILHEHGLRNGTAIFLPYDQGLEHGPRDFFANPDASDPKYILELASRVLMLEPGRLRPSAGSSNWHDSTVMADISAVSGP